MEYQLSPRIPSSPKNHSQDQLRKYSKAHWNAGFKLIHYPINQSARGMNMKIIKEREVILKVKASMSIEITG